MGPPDKQHAICTLFYIWFYLQRDSLAVDALAAGGAAARAADLGVRAARAADADLAPRAALAAALRRGVAAPAVPMSCSGLARAGLA